MNLRFGCLVIAGLCAQLPSEAAAQASSLQGTVVDHATGAPIEAAVLTLDTAPRLGASDGHNAKLHPATATTSVTGAFEFPIVAAGTYVLTAHRIGYDPVETLIDLAKGSHHAELELFPLIAHLRPIEVEASRDNGHLTAVGYFDRRSLGFGRFMDAPEIARLQAIDAVDFFRPMIESCTMIFIDALPRPLRDIALPQIAAFELYSRRMQAPAQFQNPRLDCGSLVVWTKRAVTPRDSITAH